MARPGNGHDMRTRPVAVTIIGVLFVVAGAVGLIYHFSEFQAHPPHAYELVWIPLVRAIAIVCGVYILRGHNWARWLALGWMGYHVVLSAFHAALQVAIHAVFLAALAYFLFRPRATRYFRGAGE